VGGATGPEPLTPADGASFVIGAPIDFTARDDTRGKSVYMHISKSPVLDSSGLIGHDVWIRGMSGGPEFTAQWTYSGLQQPGVYYWQAHRIDCSTPSYPDCDVEGPLRRFTITAPTAKLSLAGACYRENTPLHVNGSGFTPGAVVQLKLGSRTVTTQANGAGAISTQIKAPDVFTSSPYRESYDLKGAEAANRYNATTIRVRVTSLGMTASPGFAVREGQKIKYAFSGFVSGRPIYAHFRFRSSTRATLKLGVAKSPCGTLTTRAEMIPRGIWRVGTWTVQFDSKRRYSGSASPRLRRVIRITSVRVG
jgi:hypothetical protein